MMINRVVPVFVLFLVLSPSWAAEQPERIKKTVDSAVGIRKKTQDTVGSWHSEKDRLKGRYFQLKEEVEELRLESDRMKALVERQDAYISRVR
ncbi:MAG: DUF3450 family protein, partial [Thermodesulfobacteriota bacterium]|nr:DUF3450 family protein [Thermodesulfobacteriota bacterium]